VQRKALGRGFTGTEPMIGQGIAALFQSPPGGQDDLIREIDVEKIRPNRDQPRRHFSEAALASLAASLKEHGLLQPILVRSGEDGVYELIAGERRWRAARLAGFQKIPALVKTADDRRRMEWALLENIQREDLNPIEKAQAYARLISEFALTQEEIAARMGMDRSSVANFLRLLHLPKEIWEALASGRLSMGHAKVLLSLEREADQVALARRIQSEGGSVRQAERHALQIKEARRARPTSSPDVCDAPGQKRDDPDVADPHVADIEKRLRHALGAHVRLIHRGDQGDIHIAYTSLNDLDRLLERLL